MELKPKIPLRRIPADGCAVYVGRTVKDGAIDNPGTPHAVHIGEWIEVLPALAVGELLSLMRIQERGIGGANIAEMQASLDNLCGELSKRIIAWNWTDMMGQPLPQPYGQPNVLARLTTDELVWLLQTATRTESEDERKNA